MKSFEQTAYIKVRTQLGISPVEIHRELEAAYKDSALSYRRVAALAKEFSEGRDDIEDRPRPGRPVTTFTAQNIQRVRDVLEDNPYATYAEIIEQTSICHGSVFQIIHDALELRKVASRYVPHMLSDENKKKTCGLLQRESSHLSRRARPAMRFAITVSGENKATIAGLEKVRVPESLFDAVTLMQKHSFVSSSEHQGPCSRMQ